jgi:hypothetical protein
LAAQPDTHAALNVIQTELAKLTVSLTAIEAILNKVE